MHICFSSHCIVLFPLRTPASWRSAKCTRRLFKVWRNWPNSKLICYSERGEPRLSFEYKFVGHPWKLLKLYPTVDSYFFFLHTVLYCFHWEHQQVEWVRSAHGVSFWRNWLQNWYVFSLRTPASWMSAKCTRRLFKVWRNLAKFKIDKCFFLKGRN